MPQWRLLTKFDALWNCFQKATTHAQKPNNLAAVLTDHDQPVTRHLVTSPVSREL
jgi:hypothetical protein